MRCSIDTLLGYGKAHHPAARGNQSHQKPQPTAQCKTAYLTGTERTLVEVEIANRFTGVSGFFGFFYRFLELLLQQVGGMLMRLHRLPEN